MKVNSQVEAYGVLHDPTLRKRLEAKLLTDDPRAKFYEGTRCHIFTGSGFKGDISFSDKGRCYGQITVKGIGAVKTHRVAMILHTGKAIPDRVLHGCDVCACANPLHLRNGSQADNLADMVAKGRHEYFSGELNPNASVALKNIGASVVKRIRQFRAKRKWTFVRIAELFNTEPHVVRVICRGKAYQHIGGPTEEKPKTRAGEDNANAKISQQFALKLRELYKTGQWTHSSLARKFKLKSAVVQRLCNGETWKELGPPIKLNKNYRNGSNLTVEQVKTIRKEAKAGVFQRDIAKKYGITQSGVSAIVLRKVRKDVT